MRNIKRWLNDETGQDLIEYALLATFISLAAVVAIQSVGPVLQNWYAVMAAALPA